MKYTLVVLLGVILPAGYAVGDQSLNRGKHLESIVEYQLDQPADLNQSDENRTITDETLKKLMESAKSFLSYNMTFKNITFLEKDDKQFLNASVTEASVLGLNSYDVIYTKSNMDELQFLVTINFPVIIVTGSYGLLLDNDLFTIFGNGSLSVNVTNLNAALTITLEEKDGKFLAMKDFVPIINIEETKVWLDNLENSGEATEAVNSLINEVLPDVLDVERPNLQKMAKDVVFNKTKTILSNLSLKALIDIIYMIIGE